MLPDNILFSVDPSNDILSLCSKKNYSSLGILVDDQTRQYCYPLLQPTLPEHFVIEIPSGEEQKNLSSCEKIWQAMTDHHMDRHALLLVIGGGVLGDMGGFCAATYKRGIDFVLMPTTLLAQVDASIGGKLGIDFNHLKNHIGVFQNPVVTILYSRFLKTLPTSELRSGFAEVIKHCLISDQEMWNTIRKKNLEQQDWDVLVRHSVAFKASVTTADPKEKGLRKILNAGHTIGHALESYLLGKGHRILHGEAIAIGLIAEAFIARQKTFITGEELQTITQYILEIFKKVELKEEDIAEAVKLALQDKKNKGNKILCVMLNGIGNAKWDVEITIEEVKAALRFYQSC